MFYLFPKYKKNQVRCAYITKSIRFAAILGLSCLILLTGCKIADAPAPDESLILQTNTTHYNCESVREDLGMTVTNRLPITIEVAGVCNFLVYRRTEGWKLVKVVERRSMPVIPECYQPSVIAPGETVSIKQVAELSGQTIQACDETYRVAAPFTVQQIDNSKERLAGILYTEFTVGEPSTGIVGGLGNVDASSSESPTRIKMQNHQSRGSIWIIPFCSQASQELVKSASIPGFYPYATLERKITGGAWEVITPEFDKCAKNQDQIEIQPGQEKSLILWEKSGFDWEQLPPGWYRWHIVYYGMKYETGVAFTLGKHRFLTEFQIKD